MVHTSQTGYLQTGAGWEADNDTGIGPGSPGTLFSNTAQTGAGICGALWEATADATFKPLEGPLGETSECGYFWCGEGQEASGGPSGYIGIVVCSGSATPTVGALGYLLGITHALGSCAGDLNVFALGIANERGGIVPSVRLLGLLGLTTCQGLISSKVSALAKGQATCQGSAASVVAFKAAALGIVRTSGATPITLLVAARGVAKCSGSIVPPLLGSAQTCVAGKDGPATLQIPKNRVY